MKTRLSVPRILLIVFLISLVLCGCLLPWLLWRNTARPSPEESRLRQSYIDYAMGYLDAAEGDPAHLQLLNIYNRHTPLAQNYEVQPQDNWCAAFVSAAAIATQLTDIIPTECGCQRQIALFEALGRWQEKDTYIPLPGDLIYYSSHGVGLGDNNAWSDHVGIVTGTWGPFVTVIEGNHNNCVKLRTVLIYDPSIRGYALPDYSKKAAQN